MAQFVLPASNEDLMKDLNEWGAMEGHVGEDMLNAWIQSQAALAPAATCQEVGATTDAQKAWVTCKIASGENLGGGNVTGTVAKAGGKRTVAKPASKLSPAQEAALQAHVASTMAQKANTSNNSSISKFFVARPTSEEYIDAGTMGTIKAESWKTITDKIASGEYQVCPDFADKEGNQVLSKTNYDLLVQAAAAKSETVPVMRNGKVGAAIGYNVEVSDSASAHADSQIFTKAALQHFVEMKAAGYIIAGPTTLGVQLRTITVKSKTPNTPETQRVVLSDTNKKAAVEAKNYTSIREVSPTLEKKTQKSDLVFYVNKAVVTTDAEGKKVVDKTKFQTDTKGNVRRFAIRASVECMVHGLNLMKEYEGVFPSGRIDPTKPLDGDQLAKVAAATVHDLAITLSDRNNVFTVDERLRDDLQALQQVIGEEAKAPSNVQI